MIWDGSQKTLLHALEVASICRNPHDLRVLRGKLREQRLLTVELDKQTLPCNPVTEGTLQEAVDNYCGDAAQRTLLLARHRKEGGGEADRDRLVRVLDQCGLYTQRVADSLGLGADFRRDYARKYYHRTKHKRPRKPRPELASVTSRVPPHAADMLRHLGDALREAPQPLLPFEHPVTAAEALVLAQVLAEIRGTNQQ